MATKRTRKKVDKVESGSVKATTITLPKTIELICAKTGMIKEYKLDHAQRILSTQTISHQGTYNIFNEQLYIYDEGSRTINQRQSKPSEGNTITNTD